MKTNKEVSHQVECPFKNGQYIYVKGQSYIGIFDKVIQNKKNTNDPKVALRIRDVYTKSHKLSEIVPVEFELKFKEWDYVTFIKNEVVRYGVFIGIEPSPRVKDIPDPYVIIHVPHNTILIKQAELSTYIPEEPLTTKEFRDLLGLYPDDLFDKEGKPYTQRAALKTYATLEYNRGVKEGTRIQQEKLHSLVKEVFGSIPYPVPISYPFPPSRF